MTVEGSYGEFYLKLVSLAVSQIIGTTTTLSGTPTFTLNNLNPADRVWLTKQFLSGSSNPPPPDELPEGFTYSADLHRGLNEHRFEYTIDDDGLLADFEVLKNRGEVGNTPADIPFLDPFFIYAAMPGGGFQSVLLPHRSSLYPRPSRLARCNSEILGSLLPITATEPRLALAVARGRPLQSMLCTLGPAQRLEPMRMRS